MVHLTFVYAHDFTIFLLPLCHRTCSSTCICLLFVVIIGVFFLFYLYISFRIAFKWSPFTVFTLRSIISCSVLPKYNVTYAFTKSKTFLPIAVISSTVYILADLSINSLPNHITYPFTSSVYQTLYLSTVVTEFSPGQNWFFGSTLRQNWYVVQLSTQFLQGLPQLHHFRC